MPDSIYREPNEKKDNTGLEGVRRSNVRGDLPPMTTERKLATPLPYLLGWITGLLFYFFAKNRYVRYHALQSIFVFGSITFLQVVILLIRRMLMVLLKTMDTVHPLVNLLGTFSAVVWVGSLILWAFLMVKAFQGENYRFPVAGDIAARGMRLLLP